MPSFKFKTCRLLLGNVRNRVLTISKLFSFRNKTRSIRIKMKSLSQFLKCRGYITIFLLLAVGLFLYICCFYVLGLACFGAEMAQIAGSIGAKALSSRLVSIFFRKIGCPPTMMVVLSLSMAKLCVFPDMLLSMDSAECAHKPEEPELRLGPPETPLERGKASLPSLNELPPILYEQQIQIPGGNLINVELEKNEMASLIKQLPKKELKDVIGKDSILKPINEFNAEQQEQLRDLAINHFSVKNAIIAKMKSLYPEDEWEFTTVVREKFFQGRQKGRESYLGDLQRMLSALNEQGKSASCASRLRYNISNWNWKE